MSHVQVDEARSAADRWSYHTGHCPAQPFFERAKGCDATCTLIFCAGLRRFFTALRSTGAFIGHYALHQKRASIVGRQPFGADHPGKQRLVNKILLNGP